MKKEETTSANIPQTGHTLGISFDIGEEIIVTISTRTAQTLAASAQEKNDTLAAYEDSGLTPEEAWEYGIARDEERLKILPPYMERDDRGLKEKYHVFKARSGEAVKDCFVLRPDIDPAAQEALRAYASATRNRVLAEDILLWLAELERFRPTKERGV